jgi:four helix bundle protein
MSENKLVDLSIELSVMIVKMIDGINSGKSAYMTDQLARAGTSVGANIHEAQYAQSRRDFIHKMELALKEANEASYWLTLLFRTNRIDEDTFFCAERLCGNIRRLLIASCTTAKQKK